MVRLAVILLNYRNPGDTLECLRSLARAGATASNAKIFLVNNFPQDGSGAPLLDFLKSAPFLFDYQEPEVNTGFAGGCNLGIREALKENFSTIVLLNNDTVVEPNFIEEARRLAGEHPDDILAGLVRETGTGKMDHNIGRISRWTGRVHHIFDPEYQGEIDFVSGCLMIIPRDVLTKTGGFDEGLFMYAEDLDLSMRFKKAGAPMRYCPSILVHHKFSASAKASGLPKEYYIQRNQTYVILRRGRPVQRLFYLLSLLALPFYKAVRYPKFFRQAVTGAWDGIWGRLGQVGQG